MSMSRFGGQISRVVQFFFALALLALSLPILFVLYFVILIDSGRPFLYRGHRVGMNGRVYWMYKIRTLKVGAENRIGAALLKRNDDSITRVGRILRHTKLDELPQLWNILCGDMNFVGPRPVRPIFYDQYNDSIPGYARRFGVKPGLTGPAQIFAKYESSPLEKLDHELRFINSDGVAQRIKFVFLTIAMLTLNLFSPRFSFHHVPDSRARRPDVKAKRPASRPARETSVKVVGVDK